MKTRAKAYTALAAAFFVIMWTAIFYQYRCFASHDYWGAMPKSAAWIAGVPFAPFVLLFAVLAWGSWKKSQ